MTPLQQSAHAFSRAAAAFDEQLSPGTVTLGGQPYVAAVTVGALEPQDVDGKTAWVQQIVITLQKTVHPATPVAKVLVTYAGREYKIKDVAGYHATDAAWEVHAIRFA